MNELLLCIFYLICEVEEVGIAPGLHKYCYLIAVVNRLLVKWMITLKRTRELTEICYE